jgi:hypothetical protein
MIYLFEHQEPDMHDIRGSSMLKRTSWFVLEVFPYLVSALIAAVVVPGFLYSLAHETKAAVAANGPRLEMIHWDTAVLTADSARTAEDKAAYRQGEDFDGAHARQPVTN